MHLVLFSCYEFQILMTDQEGDQLFNDRHLQKIMLEVRT